MTMKFSEVQPNYVEASTAILFASYEERCMTVPRALRDAGFHGEAAVFHCEDLPNQSTSRNLSEIVSQCGFSARPVPVSFRDPVRIIRALTTIDLKGPLLVDVSCFNRSNLFPFLWASGLGKTGRDPVWFSYSAPGKYGPWFTREYDKPTNMLGFPGGLHFPETRVLLCAVGYETPRVLEVIKAAEPSRVILLLGTRPTRKEFEERNRQAVREVHGSTGFEIRQMDVSHPDNCLADLDTILTELGRPTGIHFAPFSTKLSCLAMWALWLTDPSIRIWNAQPKEYNILDYSKGSASPRYFRVDW